MTLNCDVAIIGGGPAGTTVAALLKKYSPFMDVIIIEREQFPRDHVGESHLPAISEILVEMGVWDKVESAEFPIKVGAVYRWGATDELWDLDFLDGTKFIDEPRPARYTGQRTQTAFQVDRSIYDKVLLDHSRELGCQVFERTKVTLVERSGDQITGLECEGEEFSGRIEARYYIDGSGDSGIIRRKMEIEIEEPTILRNIAFWDYWVDADWAVTLGNGGTRIVIMSLGWGWLWFIPITSTRTSIGLVLPASYFKESGKTKEALYAEAIASEPLISELVKNAKCEGQFQATKDWNFISKRLAGEKWFLIGDACGFADPILSAGMTLAHTSGRKVAYSILELERGNLEPEWLQAEYSEGHRAQIRNHIQFADYWYSSNGRFTDLKEHCSEIAQSAGLKLDAERAFRWLASGGFALESPGSARAVSFRVAGIKHLIERFGGEVPAWEFSKSNVWSLNKVGAHETSFALYEMGRVLPIRCLRRGHQVLPIVGIYEHLLKALAHSNDAVTIYEECVNKVIQEGNSISESSILVSEAIESLIAEQWITTQVDPSRPLIKVAEKMPSR